jgi:cytochrome c biogenesis protein CcmG, thiol:disulfide interchange protein DsbE
MVAGVVAILAAFVVLAVVLASRFGSDPSLTASPLVGQPAPDFTLTHLDDAGEFRMAGTAGDIVVVNFWASWCIPCRQEHAALVRAAADYDDLGVRFVGVLYQDSAENGRRFLDDLGRSEAFTYVVDERSRAALDFGVFGIPETFFVDRSGIVVGKVSSAVTYDLLSATLDAIIVGDAVGTG